MWKDVNKELPPAIEWVLVSGREFAFDEDPQPFIAHYDSEYGGWYIKDSGARLYEVTHWMKIPELPEV